MCGCNKGKGKVAGPNAQARANAASEAAGFEYRAVTAAGDERTFRTRTEAQAFLAGNGGGSVRPVQRANA